MTAVPSEAAELVFHDAHNRRGAPWKSRTHCDYGHPFDERNTLRRKDSTPPGARRCRICHRAAARRWHAKRRAARAARACA
jgi:hypothetical protein